MLTTRVPRTLKTGIDRYGSDWSHLWPMVTTIEGSDGGQAHEVRIGQLPDLLSEVRAPG